MLEAIVSIGYRPTIVQSRLPSNTMAVPSGPIPEPLASLLKETSKPILVDFYASWCGACKLMELTTLKDPTFIKTIERFHFIKIDVDDYPDLVRHFRVVGMPTYIVLSKSGVELYRQVGPIEAIEFNQALIRSVMRDKQSPSR